MSATELQVERVLAFAEAMEGLGELPVLSNAGPIVEPMLKLTVPEAPVGSPWCAAFVTWCLLRALKEKWKGPCSAYVPSWVTWGRNVKAVVTVPQRGDLVAVYHPELSRYGHIAIVLGVDPDGAHVTTIEGNTNPGGGRDGWGVYRRKRLVPRAVAETTTPALLFIRWSLTL